jgi:predicted nucleotidyltransferase
MNNRQLLEKNRTAIIEIAAKYGARNVRLFGSVVRGESDQSSDIDLLMEFPEDMSFFRHIELIDELEALLGCKVDVVSDRGLKKRIKARVLAEAVPL